MRVPAVLVSFGVVILASAVLAGDSLNIRLMGSCDTPGDASGVTVNGSYAYVADHGSGLRVISVADPANPVEVGHCGTPSYAEDVAVVGDYAYVTNYTAGLRVISIADPTQPTEIGYYGSTGGIDYVAARGGYAFVSDRPSRLTVVSVADPAHPVRVGYYGAYNCLGLSVSGDYAFVARGQAGLQISEFYDGGVEESPNAEAQTTRCAPTVVRGVLFLDEAADHKSRPASLRDVAGRTVMELHAGANNVRALAPGVYFLREAQAPAPPPAARKIIVFR